MSRIARAAVLGRPIEHSLSPVLHRAAYRALGLDWRYEAINCGVDELAAVLAAREGWAGFSCTMPLKHAVLDVAEQVGALAKLVGAANTLLPRADGGWIAENTDVAGILAALAGAPRGQRAAVLGAGGTAQAALVALALRGVATCAVLVRDRSRAGDLLATAEAAGVHITLSDLGPDNPELGAELVVSTLPRGAADVLAARAWAPGQTVLDVVYDPWPTALATAVGSVGAAVLSGALVLLHQAAAQVELMTGAPAPLEAMRAALLAVAPQCGA